MAGIVGSVDGLVLLLSGMVSLLFVLTPGGVEDVARSPVTLDTGWIS